MDLLISLLILALVIGLIFYLIGMLPIDARFKQIVQVILIIIAVIFLLQMLVGPGGNLLRIR